MKKILFIFAIFLIAAVSVHAQDTEPQALQFRFIQNGNTVYHPFMPPPQTKFHLGWQWAFKTRTLVNSALKKSF